MAATPRQYQGINPARSYFAGTVMHSLAVSSLPLGSIGHVKAWLWYIGLFAVAGNVNSEGVARMFIGKIKPNELFTADGQGFEGHRWNPASRFHGRYPYCEF